MHRECDHTGSDLHAQRDAHYACDRTDREDRQDRGASIAARDPSPPGLPDFAPGVVRGGPQASTSEAPKIEDFTESEPTCFLWGIPVVADARHHGPPLMLPRGWTVIY